MTPGYVSYFTGGYDDAGFLNERRFRCDYRLRGIGRKYVLVRCNDTKTRKIVVSFRLHGRSSHRH